MSVTQLAGLHVEDTGTGPAVVLLHSSGLSGRQWSRLAADLVASGRRAIVPDLTGHGRSEPLLEPTPFAFGRDVERVVEIVRANAPVHVVGHSYGGLIALHVALAAPAAVRSVAVFDPVAFGALDRDGDRDARAVLGELDLTWGPTADDRERWLAGFVEFWSGRGAWQGLGDKVRAEFLRIAWVVEEGVRTLSTDPTDAATFGTIAVPVALLTGEQTPLPARRVVERLGAAIAGARVSVVPRVGHLGPVLGAAAVNRIILDAIAAAEAAASHA